MKDFVILTATHSQEIYEFVASNSKSFVMPLRKKPRI